MRYVCVHCDHKWEADAQQPPKRCPSCLRANGPQVEAAAESGTPHPRQRSKAALVGLGVAVILAAVAGYFVWGGRPSAGERPELAPLSAGELTGALERAQVDAGDLAQLLVADPAITAWAERVAGSASGGPYAKAEAIHAAVRARASALGFVPWSLGEPRSSRVGTAAQTLAAIEKDGARFEAYPLELAALEVAALRALDQPALLADCTRWEGSAHRSIRAATLGYFVAVLYPGEPGLGTPRLFDHTGGGRSSKAPSTTVLRDHRRSAARWRCARSTRSRTSAIEARLDSSSQRADLERDAALRAHDRGMVVLAGRLAGRAFRARGARQQRDDAPASTPRQRRADDRRPRRAQKELTAALERAPDFASAHASRATLLLMQRETSKPARRSPPPTSSRPDLSLVQWARAELALRDGDPQQARTIAERALRPAPRSTHACAWACCCARSARTRRCARTRTSSSGWSLPIASPKCAK